MNLIRIFIVAWVFERGSMAPRRTGGVGVQEGRNILAHQEEPINLPHPDAKIIGEYLEYMDRINECFLLCRRKSYEKLGLRKNRYNTVKRLSDNELIFHKLNVSQESQGTESGSNHGEDDNIGEDIFQVEDNIRNEDENVQVENDNIRGDDYILNEDDNIRGEDYNLSVNHANCDCIVTLNNLNQVERVKRSVELPINRVTSQNMPNEDKFSDKQLQQEASVSEKYFSLLLNDPSTEDERNGRLYASDNDHADILLAIPKAMSASEDILPEHYDHDYIVDTENVSVTTRSPTLFTESFETLENTYFDRNLSAIRVLMKEEEEVLNIPRIFISTDLEEGNALPTRLGTTDNLDDSSLLLTTLQNFETENSFRLRKISVVVNSSDVYAVFRSRYPVDEWKSLGYFTEDYLGLINRHWLQFPPPRHSSHYILATLYTAIMSVGVAGNCLVIFMFIRCRSLRTPANVLVMNLAVSDFFLLAKMPVFIFNSFYFGPALGAIGCEIYGFLGGLTGTVSIMTLAAIALDRYYVIVYPLDPLRRTTRQRARLCVAFVWCYGCVFASLPLTGYGFSRYVPEGYLTSCSFDYLNQAGFNRVFILVFFFAAWVVPFTVIAFCYIRIYRVVISGSSGASSRRGQEEEKRKTEIRLAGVIVGVIGLWFVAWTPYAIVALLGISGNAHLISPLSSMIPALFCKTASCIDPYVYAVTHPRFRREFQRFFCNKQTRRRFEGGKTQCWKTESSQIPGMMIGLRHQRVEYSLSEEDIEEMVVMVDNRPQKMTYFTASTIAPEERNLCEVTFPPDSRTNERLQHPSWFIPPQPQRDRSTSLKLTAKRASRSVWSDPTSV